MVKYFRLFLWVFLTAIIIYSDAQELDSFPFYGGFVLDGERLRPSFCRYKF